MKKILIKFAKLISFIVSVMAGASMLGSGIYICTYIWNEMLIPSSKSNTAGIDPSIFEVIIGGTAFMALICFFGVLTLMLPFLVGKWTYDGCYRFLTTDEIDSGEEE